MPYLIRKRGDIPNGAVQVLDLFPNTSQRAFPYQKVGQTGYVPQINLQAGTTLVGGVVSATIEGLVAFLLGQVSNGAGAKATATLTVDTFANLTGGQTFTISDGVNTVTFEIVKTGADLPVTAGNVPVSIVGAVTAANVSLICTNTINGVAAQGLLDVTAVDGGGTVALTNNNENIALALQNNTNNAETLGGLGAITNFVGATASAPLTPSQAVTNANDILSLINYNSPAAAGAVDLASVNGALTTGALVPSQHAALMQVLAGRPFSLPAGTDLGAASFTPGGAFTDDPAGIRTYYQTGYLTLSFLQGNLRGLTSANFSYEVPGVGPVLGAAVVVYNDDGTLYTG
jgi:hypothetical protein